MSFEIDGVKCIRNSGKAILVEGGDFDEPQWIPQSVVTSESEVYDLESEGTLIVHEWFAEKKGWL